MNPKPINLKVRVLGKPFKDKPWAELDGSQQKAILLHKEWGKSVEAREFFDNLCDQTPMAPEKQDYFPTDYGKGVHRKGAWIRILSSPGTQYTVPPFSMWFARPWPQESGKVAGVLPKRVKITTPEGDLGLYPREYAVIGDIREYLGQEADGVYPRYMGGHDRLDKDKVHYIMSRGISRKDACNLLLGEMRSMDFMWFEMHPAYANEFGLEWPSPKKCPFATTLKQWKEAS